MALVIRKHVDVKIKIICPECDITMVPAPSDYDKKNRRSFLCQKCKKRILLESEF